MRVRKFLRETDPILKLAALVVLCCCIAAARRPFDVWLFFTVALALALATGIGRNSAHAPRRRKKIWIILILVAVLSLSQLRFLQVWFPLDVALRFASLMLLGWTVVETTPIASLAGAAARLSLPGFVRSLLILSAAIVPAILAEAWMTVETLKFKRNETPPGNRMRAYPKLLLRSAFVFVLRVFMRADELAELAVLRGLENPTHNQSPPPYRPAVRDLVFCSAAAGFGLIVVLY